MKNIFIIILTISTLKVAGQNHLIGVKVGANSTNITSTNFISETDSRSGLAAGLSYEFLIKRHFSIGADFIYNQRGVTYDMVFTDNIGNPTGEKYITKFNYDYVSLPIKVGFNIGTKLYGFTIIGVIPSLLVEAKTTTPTFDMDGNFTGNKTFNVTNRVSKFDFAGIAEIGGGYKFNNRFWLFTSFAYQHSVTTITNSEYFANSIIKHNGMALILGLKCALIKE
jgi:hypothetical protein